MELRGNKSWATWALAHLIEPSFHFPTATSLSFTWEHKISISEKGKVKGGLLPPRSWHLYEIMYFTYQSNFVVLNPVHTCKNILLGFAKFDCNPNPYYIISSWDIYILLVINAPTNSLWILQMISCWVLTWFLLVVWREQLLSVCVCVCVLTHRLRRRWRRRSFDYLWKNMTHVHFSLTLAPLKGTFCCDPLESF